MKYATLRMELLYSSASGGKIAVLKRHILISLLKTTRNGSLLIEDISRDVRIASDMVTRFLRQLQSEGFIQLDGDLIQADAAMRMQLALKALSEGADIESISRLLRWQEFEGVASAVLERYGYVVQRNVRFKHGGRQMEIDVVGCRNPLVVCVDCKHWRQSLSPSSLKKFVANQVERTSALADALPDSSTKLVCRKWHMGRFVPVILSLCPPRSRFHNNVPIVAILQFQDFVSELPVNVTAITQIVRFYQ